MISYKGKNILVTGHNGFKGSWLCLLLRRLGANVFGVSLENHNSMLHFYTKNKTTKPCSEKIFSILDKNKLCDYMDEIKPDLIFHLAAQPIVFESYRDPYKTIETNIMGTVNVFEAARLIDSVHGIVSIATDKVYINNNWAWGYREIDPLGADDPYSASKAAQEIITNSYAKSFFRPNNKVLCSARAGNVYGGGDLNEKRLIPDIYRAIVSGTSIELRNPNATRPWVYVLDPLWGYILLGDKIFNGIDVSGPWNFGPDSSQEFKVKDVLLLFKNKWGDSKIEEVLLSKTFPEQGRLKLDSSKAIENLDWHPLVNIEYGIEQTVKWYQQFSKGVCIADHLIDDYLSKTRIAFE